MFEQVAGVAAAAAPGVVDDVGPVERALRVLAAGLDIETLKRRFLEDELLVLPNFVPAPMLADMVAETHRLIPKARRSYLPFVRKGGAISHPTIVAEAPALHAFQGSRVLRETFQRVVDGPVLEARKQDDVHASAIYTYTSWRDHIKWHYDDCGCEPQAAYSIILGLVDQSSSLLELVTFKKTPGKQPVRRLVKVDPGMLIFFCGSNVWHRVTPLGFGEQRATFSFVYVKANSHPHGWDAIKLQAINTLLYFGPRAIFKRRPDL